MERSYLFQLIALILSIALLTNCGKNDSPNDPMPSPFGSEVWRKSKYLGKYSPELFNSNLTDGYEQMKKSLSEIPTENDAQKSAIEDALRSLEQFRLAYKKHSLGMTASQLALLFSALNQARTQASKVATALKNAGLSSLANAFDEMAAKVDVHRFFKPLPPKHNAFSWKGTKEIFDDVLKKVDVFKIFDHKKDDHSYGDHYFTSQAQEGYHAVANAGYVYLGIGMRVYNPERGGCNVLLRRCIVNSSHFLSVDPSCEGQQDDGAIGYVCPNQTANAVNHLARFYSPSDQHFYASALPEEQDFIQANGWYLEGYLGYTPN